MPHTFNQKLLICLRLLFLRVEYHIKTSLKITGKRTLRHYSTKQLVYVQRALEPLVLKLTTVGKKKGMKTLGKTTTPLAIYKFIGHGIP